VGSCGAEQHISQAATMVWEDEVLTAKHAPSRARKVRKLQKSAMAESFLGTILTLGTVLIGSCVG
jgi:hypothetical protein